MSEREARPRRVRAAPGLPPGEHNFDPRGVHTAGPLGTLPNTQRSARATFCFPLPPRRHARARARANAIRGRFARIVSRRRRRRRGSKRWWKSRKREERVQRTRYVSPPRRGGRCDPTQLSRRNSRGTSSALEGNRGTPRRTRGTRHGTARSTIPMTASRRSPPIVPRRDATRDVPAAAVAVTCARSIDLADKPGRGYAGTRGRRGGGLADVCVPYARADGESRGDTGEREREPDERWRARGRVRVTTPPTATTTVPRSSKRPRERYATMIRLRDYEPRRSFPLVCARGATHHLRP